MSEVTPILTIFVSDTVLVSETLVVELIVLRLTSYSPRESSDVPVVSIQEYRDLLGDFTSTDEQIRLRLEYVEMLCRDIIKTQLRIYGKSYVYGKR